MMKWAVGIKFKDGWRFVRSCDEFGNTFTEFEREILWFTQQDAERICTEEEDERVHVLRESEVKAILKERAESYREEAGSRDGLVGRGG